MTDMNKNKESNKNNSNMKGFDHESFRKQIVQLHKPDINKKHIEKATRKIQKKFDSHFSDLSNGRIIKDNSVKENTTLNVVKDIAERSFSSIMNRTKYKQYMQRKRMGIQSINSPSGLSRRVSRVQGYSTHMTHREEIEYNNQLKEVKQMNEAKDHMNMSMTDLNKSSEINEAPKGNPARPASRMSIIQKASSNAAKGKPGETPYWLKTALKNKMATAKMTHEEVEQIDELKKDTLDSYKWKARADIRKKSSIYGTSAENEKKIENRRKGLTAAHSKLANEEAEQIDELSGDFLAHASDVADKKAKEATAAGAPKLAKKRDDQSGKFGAGAYKRGISPDFMKNKSRFTSNSRSSMKLSTLTREEIELDEAKRGRPRKDGTSKPAGDEDQEANQNIHTQLHKVISANKPVKFNDGETHKISNIHAHKALSMLQNSKASERLELQNSLSHSHKRFQDTLKTGKAVMDAPRPKVSLAKSVRESAVVKPEKNSDGKVKLVKNSADNKGKIVSNDGSYDVTEEETLNNLYLNLSEQNKEIFEEMIQTAEGREKLLQFANLQQEVE